MYSSRQGHIPQLRSLAAALVVILMTAAPGRAQQALSTGTIIGVIQDAQGLAMPGVTVEAVNEQTRGVRIAVSNSTGTFNIPALVPSLYTLRASLSCFKMVEQVGIQLRSNEVFNAGTIAMVSTTLNIYTHVVDASHRSAVELVEERLFTELDPNGPKLAIVPKTGTPVSMQSA